MTSILLDNRNNILETNKTVVSTSTSVSNGTRNAADLTKTLMPEQYQIILLSFAYGIITLFSISGNSSIIYIVIRNRRMHSVTNYFTCNLALADCFVACFAVPFQVLPHFLCKLAPFVQVLCVGVSIYTLVIVSLDRCYVMLHPLKPKLSRKSAFIIFIVLKMLFTVVALFLICWFPLQLYNFLNAKFNREFRKLYSCLPRIYSNKIDGKLTDVPLLYQVQLRQVTCQQYSPNPSSQPSSRQNTTISINSIPFNTQSSSISITSNIKGKKEAVFLLKSVSQSISNDVFDADADLNTGFDVAAVSQSAGLYVDANPNIIRRPSCRCIILLLQPPILHERPPQPPVAQTSQIGIRNLPVSPEPPRSVIIERISATPYQPLGLSSSFSNLLGGSGFTGVGFDNSLLEGTGATVNSADKNKDDIIAGNEFKQFYQSGL
ncbi:unnamed protein product [Rotaria magnacalcarata]|uniref:G-protein coupled receptors family 1 profile domain-containing protein n=1 Tax=Rotaria magnacalcarata TaxID=392030 RepID=A0A818W2E4_9BILA|nr:unnamed protein product [Rotaria magnacalcarata]